MIRIVTGKWLTTEVRSAVNEISKLGHIPLVTAVGKKDWLKYGVHMLEAVFTLLDDPVPLSVWAVGEPDKAIVRIEFKNGTLATVHLFQDISSTFQVSLYGENDYIHCNINDSYKMFRANLEEFIRGLREGRSVLPFEKTYNIVRTVIAGLESIETGNKILLSKITI